MSYEVTATRRRPQKFDDLVGQEFVAETLKNSMKSGKIAHAYLFSGPRGCGKTSTARILAKALNCAKGPTDCPCGECQNCQEITKGSSLDVIEIDGASNNGVDISRQIKDEVMFPPAKCRYKIYIIDEVHMLSTPAFNALLKTIEEPPAYAVFIFATTELQKVPATIKSRCQQFNFRLVSLDKVKQCLADAAAELNIQADDEALYWIARESTGSMRDAYTLFDQVAAFSDGIMTYEKIKVNLGLVGIDRLNSIFEACSQGHTQNVLEILDEILQSGSSIEQIISNSANYLRSLLLIKSGITKESLLGNSAERYSQIVLNTWSAIQVERSLSLFLQLYRDIRYSLSPRYELQLAFSRMCWISQFVSNAEVKKAIDAAQALLMGNAGNQTGSPVGIPSGNTPDSLNLMNRINQQSNVQPNFAGNSNNQSNYQSNIQSFSSAISGNSASVTTKAASETQNPKFFSNDFGNPEKKDFIQPEIRLNINPEADEISAKQSVTEPPVSPSPVAGMTPAEVAAATLAGNLPVSNDKPAGSDRLPPGFPRLSILDELEKKEAEKINSESENPEGDASNPFYNGGSLPPYQSVNLDISDNEVFSVNPDDADDGWTNTEEPPEDDYYVESDAEIAQKLEDDIEIEKSVDKEPQNTPAQNSESFNTPQGPMSIGQLRGSVMAGLAVNNSFVATALEKTGLWKVEGNSVYTTVEAAYDLSMLHKNLPQINQELSKICGVPMNFSVSIMEKQSVQMSPRDYPAQVKIVLDCFRGSIVGR